MGKNRGILELLIFLRDDLKSENSLFETGFCPMIEEMRWLEKISNSEKNEIDNYFNINLPEKRTYSRFDELFDLEFSFPPCEKQPRINWLNKQIESLKD